jgi:uncharacterized protein YdhG (YjbR/CyaY superfamily)
MPSEDETGFPKLGAPARRALSSAGYTHLEQLAEVSEAALAKLHGMGPSAIAALRQALDQRGLSFRESAGPARGRTPATIDDYLQGVAEPKRGTLEALRRMILEIIPESEEVISYGVPAFRVGRKTVAGFAAFKDHMSYLPFSGSVLEHVADELDGCTMTKSALHFTVEHPLPEPLVKKLIALRLADR